MVFIQHPVLGGKGLRYIILKFDDYSEFYFRNNIKEYKLDFSKLSINDNVCFTLQRNKDFKKNLRRAKIIQDEQRFI